MQRSLQRGRQSGRAVVFWVPFALMGFIVWSLSSSPASEPLRISYTTDRFPNQPNLSVFQQGEELVYEVSYLAIKIGSVTTRVISVDTTRGRISYKMECLMRSYRGIPFVNLYTLFQSTMNDSLASISFSTKERLSDTLNKYINYTYPRKRNVLYISERIGNKPVPENYDTLSLDGKRWQDGLSLLFYARANAHRRYVEHVPVVIYRTKAATLIRFGVDEEEQEIDAVEYPIRAVKIDGETGFTGIFGLTGDFEGWFTKDNASVPVYAKMHVLIGSIRLELVKWKRKGWSPPRFSEKEK